MKTLELAHVAAYLPYEMNFLAEEKRWQMTAINRTPIGYPVWANKYFDKDALEYKPETNSLNLPNGVLGQGFKLSEIKPILHPLSDLTKVIEHNGERFVPLEKAEEMYGYEIACTSKGKIDEPINLLPYCVVRKFIEWHMDVYSLIPAGLAVDINTVKV